MNRPDDIPDDAALVAWIDDELPLAQAARVARHVAADPDVAARAALLRASRAEFAWALGGADADAAPPPAGAHWQAPSGRRRWRRAGVWLLAAAALVVVVLVANARAPAVDGGGGAATARNALLEVELTAARPAWELFAGGRFVLSGRALSGRLCHLLGRRDGETDAQLAARAGALHGGVPVVPIAVDAELQWASRTIRAELPAVDLVVAADPAELDFELVDLRVPHDGIAPLLTVRLDPDGAREDWRWGFGRGVAPTPGETGFVAEEPGAYRLQLRLRALPPTPGAEPAFAAPLTVAVGFAVHGVVGAWSAPVRGLSARVVASRARTRAGAPLAVALQLRNEGPRPLGYNVIGRTGAPIPQPLHFDLVVDDEPWTQDRGRALIAAEWEMLPQPVGSVRSVVAMVDHWQRDERRPSQLEGAHRLGLRFHFQPLLWDSTDPAIWHGAIDAPPIEVEFGVR
ncbi:MAG: hypothetical protein AB7O97_05970 [Planctomycetota bacterium]